MAASHAHDAIREDSISMNLIQNEQPQHVDPVDGQPETLLEDSGRDSRNNDSELGEQVEMVTISKLLRYATCCDKVQIGIGIICAVCHGVTRLIPCILFGLTTGKYVDNVQQFNFTGNLTFNMTLNTPGCTTASTADLDESMKKYASYLAAVWGVVFLFALLQGTLLKWTATRQTKRITRKYFRAILHQQMSWFDTHSIGELNSRLTDDIKTINEGLTIHIGLFTQLVTRFVAGIIIGFIHSWKLSLPVAIISALLVVMDFVMKEHIAKVTSMELSASARAGAVAKEMLVAIRTVMAFGGQQRAVDKYKENLVEAQKHAVNKIFIVNMCLGVTHFFRFIIYAVGFGCGTEFAMKKWDSVSDLVTAFLAVMIGSFSLGQGAPSLDYIAKARGAAYAIYKIIDMPRPIDSSSNEGHKPDIVNGDIEFKNLHFSYPSRKDVKIFQGLNLKVPHGKMIALVGASGCGKSTIMHLLQRFYDPDSGAVTLDGQDIRSLNVQWLRKNIGIVSKDPVLFSTTIAENIRYGREDATDEDIKQAVRGANAYEFISRLPDKLNTMVGERGVRLSGVHKRMIAIARALVKNPKILLLDEATSSLDIHSESIIQTALDQARAGRTTIVTAHRLSTICSADVIVCLRNGQVVEQGTHGQLEERNGFYYTLMQQGGWTSWRPDHETQVHFPEEEMRQEPENEGPNDLVEEENAPHVSFRRILALNKPVGCTEAWGLVASILSGIIYPSVAILFSQMLHVFAETDPEVQQQKNIMYSCLFCFFGVVAFITHFFQGFLWGKSGEIVIGRLRSRAFETIMRREIGWFDNPNNAVGVLTTKLATDASLVKGAVGSNMGLAISSVFAVLSALFVSAWYSKYLAGLTLLFVLVIVVANSIQIAQSSHCCNQSPLEIHKISSEIMENFRTIVSLTKEGVFYRKFKESFTRTLGSDFCNALDYGVVFALVQSLPYMVNVFVYYLGARLIANCSTNFNDVFLVYYVVFFAAVTIGQSSSLAPDFIKAKGAFGRILNLLEMPNIDYRAGDMLTDFQGNIEFRDVHFSYPTHQNVKILQGLNVSVAQGQTLALVGDSGCGKSTSIQLLERFYNPASGNVLADGIDIRGINLAWLRSQLALVSQEPILFDCTIAENIQYGDNSRVVSPEEIVEAAMTANIHDFIIGLPKGYNTNVGEKGTLLSGGQKRKIAIARALVRNPKVLMLDGAIDTESEDALQAINQGRTCIVTAHHLNTTRNADIIAVIQNGLVSEQGTHSELMEKEGVYYALWNVQVSLV